MSTDLNNLRPFRFWCQKVLPLVYDDSLSYYELLNKVVKHLNDVTENVNTLGTAFQELEDSLNHFVEDEVEERLDQMVEDGTLDTMVSTALDDKFEEYTHTIDSIIAGQNAKINTQDNKIATAETNISNLTTRVSTNTSEIDSMKQYEYSDMYHIPYLNFSTVGGTDSFTRANVQKWLEYVTAKYGTQIVSKSFSGRFYAGSTSLIFGHSYNMTDKVGNLPKITSMFLIPYGGEILYTCGTVNGVFYWRHIAMTTDPPANTQNAIGSRDLETQVINGSVSTDAHEEPAEEAPEEVPEEVVAEPEPEEPEEDVAEPEPVEDEPEPEPVEYEPETESEEAAEEDTEDDVYHPDTEGPEI